MKYLPYIILPIFLCSTFGVAHAAFNYNSYILKNSHSESEVIEYIKRFRSCSRLYQDNISLFQECIQVKNTIAKRYGLKKYTKDRQEVELLKEYYDSYSNLNDLEPYKNALDRASPKSGVFTAEELRRYDAALSALNKKEAENRVLIEVGFGERDKLHSEWLQLLIFEDRFGYPFFDSKFYGLPVFKKVKQNKVRNVDIY